MSKSASVLVIDGAACARRPELRAVAAAIVHSALFDGAKADELGIFIFGCEVTANSLNKEHAEEYLNVVEQFRLERPSSRMLASIRPETATASRDAMEEDEEPAVVPLWPAPLPPPEDGTGPCGGVDAVVVAARDLLWRVKQLKYVKAAYLLTDEHFRFLERDDEEGVGDDGKAERQLLKETCVALKQNEVSLSVLQVWPAGTPPCRAAEVLNKAAKLTRGTYDACPDADALREKCVERICERAVAAGTREGKMELRLGSLAFACEQIATFKKSSIPTRKKESSVGFHGDGTSGDGVVDKDVSFVVEGETDDVQGIDLVKGYRYGDEYVPLSDDVLCDMMKDRDEPADPATGGLATLVCFAPAKHFASPAQTLGEPLRSMRPTDARSSAMLGSLARRLRAKGRVALVMWKLSKASKNPALYTLSPPALTGADEPAHATPFLVARRVPFADDRRDYYFDPLAAKSSPALDSAMEAVMAASLLSDEEALRIVTRLRNPLKRRFFEDVVAPRVIENLTAVATTDEDAPSHEVADAARFEGVFGGLSSPTRATSAQLAEASQQWRVAFAAAAAAAQKTAADAQHDSKKHKSRFFERNADKDDHAATAPETLTLPPAGGACGTAPLEAESERTIATTSEIVSDFWGQLGSAFKKDDAAAATAVRAAMERAIGLCVESGEDSFFQLAADALAALRHGCDATTPLGAAHPECFSALAAQRFDEFLREDVAKWASEEPVFRKGAASVCPLDAAAAAATADDARVSQTVDFAHVEPDAAAPADDGDDFD